MPAEAGIQDGNKKSKQQLDSGFRRNDDLLG